MNKIISIEKQNPWVSIMWQVSNVCNFKCSYCNSFSNGGDNNNIVDNKTIKNIEKILETYKNNGINRFILKLTGGEPTIYNIQNIIDTFKNLIPDDKLSVIIHTNLSQSISWWKTNYHYFDEVNCSFHTEFTNTNKYIEKVVFLQDKVQTCTRLMMKPNNFDKCLYTANKIKELSQNYDIEYVPLLKTLSPNAERMNYSSDELDILKNTHEKSFTITVKKPNIGGSISHYINNSEKTNINEIISTNKNKFKGYNCNIFENIFISSNGNITQSTCGQGNDVGNIFGEINEQKIMKSVTCNKNTCTCGADIHNTKTKDINE